MNRKIENINKITITKPLKLDCGKTIKEFPAIIHADGTSRVQTVSKEDNPGFRKLLETFYEKTGCPMLLNTSLNIRGEPLVNNEQDAKAFEERYKVKVFTGEN